MEKDQIYLAGPLFESVQMQQIFSDGKTFVDCTARGNLTDILARYESEKGKQSFDLASFVHSNFIPPTEKGEDFRTDASLSVTAHLRGLWEVLTRRPELTHDSLIPLPHPYIVPGGRFREIYYWDSYFTMLGLEVSGRIDLIENMVDNFAYLIDQIGYIPNGNRTYYLGRSQPPFFSCMVKLLSGHKGPQTLVKYLPQMQKEYHFWMKGSDILSENIQASQRVVRLDRTHILNRYWDENETPRPESYREDMELAGGNKDLKGLFRNIRAGAESGWDFSSRWFKNGKDFSTIHITELIPVDLNCLLFHLEKTLSEAYEVSGETQGMCTYRDLSENRKQAVLQYCWSASKGTFVDYDFAAGHSNDSLTVAMAFPLFFEMVSEAQAASVARTLENFLLKQGGLVTTTRTTGQQWDAPNGWAPHQWIAVKGLMSYGQKHLAQEIARRWMTINDKVFRATGKMMEKYNVENTDLVAGGGEYPAQDGFGWTNGVYLALEQLFPSAS